MTAPQTTTFFLFIFSIFVREVSALKEKEDIGSQSMLMDQTPNPNVTKKVSIYLYHIRVEMSSRGRGTNKFPTDFSFQCSGVQSCVAEFEHQIRQNDLSGEKNDTCSCGDHSL